MLPTGIIKPAVPPTCTSSVPVDSNVIFPFARELVIVVFETYRLPQAAALVVST